MRMERSMPRDYPLWPGKAYPLGATVDGLGVNFAVYAPSAERVEICLFDSADERREVQRFRLVEKTAHVWHGYVPGLPTGTLYGIRAYGPYEPAGGLRFNGAKLLVDPYARAVTGKVDWSAPAYGYPMVGRDRDLLPDAQDDAWGVPKSVVVADLFDWAGDQRPQIPWHRSVVYELHVRGFTMRHPHVPEPCAARTQALRRNRRSSICSASASRPWSFCRSTSSSTTSTSSRRA